MAQASANAELATSVRDQAAHRDFATPGRTPAPLGLSTRSRTAATSPVESSLSEEGIRGGLGVELPAQHARHTQHGQVKACIRSLR